VKERAIRPESNRHINDPGLKSHAADRDTIKVVVTEDASAMQYYRCYLITAACQIRDAKILTCADDDDARGQCRQLFLATAGYASAEVWERERRVGEYPVGHVIPLSENERRRHGDASYWDRVIADALSARIAEERRSLLENEARKLPQPRTAPGRSHGG
jgi:hypothetical protein